MILVALGLGLALLLLERLRPAHLLPHVPGWWRRALALNGFQLGLVLLGGWTWERGLGGPSLLRLSAHLPTPLAGLVGYLIASLIYYAWHRARHEVPLLWRWFHQLHHAPRRMEVLTAFYKHPLEVLANAALSAAISYPLCGCSPAAAAVVTLLSAQAEFFYHANLRTPRWVGWLIQRPESHRVHHERGRHAANYGDLPVWDWLFGTLENPRQSPALVGFEPAREARTWDMLAGRDVHAPAPSPRPLAHEARLRRANALSLVVLAVGLLQPVGWLTGWRGLRGVGAVSQASPLPLVFTGVRGHETFAAEFTLAWDGPRGPERVTLDARRAAGLRGPYNRRNVYGAALSYGPVLPPALWEPVLAHGLGPDGPLRAELGIPADARDVRAIVTATARAEEGRVWTLGPVSGAGR